MFHRNRREFMRDLGLSALAFPLLTGLPSLGFAAESNAAKQRLIIMFSPNGTIPGEYWPDQEGTDFTFKRILEPLIPFKDKTLLVKGICDQVKGDGDSHMRGMSCLLTGIELLPGNIQGGSHTPAGWASGHSIDQELKNFLQSKEETRTRFGSLEFGVNIPERADPWTRMVYAGPNKPVSPIDDPYQMFAKLYGKVEERELLVSVLDDVHEDLNRVKHILSKEDQHKLDDHQAFVRQMENELKNYKSEKLNYPAPIFTPGIRESDQNMPIYTEMQINLLVNALANDMSRIATFQFTNSVGNARMHWLDIKDSHHELSHKPNDDKESQEKLIKINTWYAEQIAALAKKLADTPEPGGSGSMLDHTTIIWTNELGVGNSHTLDDIPFVMVGGGLGFKTGRSLKLNNIPHNRLLLSIAQGFGHHLKTFGNPNHCADGPLSELT